MTYLARSQMIPADNVVQCPPSLRGDQTAGVAASDPGIRGHFHRAYLEDTGIYKRQGTATFEHLLYLCLNRLSRPTGQSPRTSSYQASI